MSRPAVAYALPGFRSSSLSYRDVLCSPVARLGALSRSSTTSVFLCARHVSSWTCRAPGAKIFATSEGILDLDAAAAGTLNTDQKRKKPGAKKAPRRYLARGWLARRRVYHGTKAPTARAGPAVDALIGKVVGRKVGRLRAL